MKNHPFNWYTKPPAGAELDENHPLSRGLNFFWLFNEGAGTLINNIGQESAVGSPSTRQMLIRTDASNNTCTWVPAMNGFGLLHTAQSGVNGVLSTNPIQAYTGFWSWDTWVYQYGLGSDGNQSLHMGGNVGMQINTTSGVEKLSHRFSSSDHLANSPIPRSKWTYLAATHNGTGTVTYFYMNGAPDGNSGATTSNFTPRAMLQDDVASTTGYNGICLFQRIWNRSLSEDEIKWLYRDPYAMVKAPAYRRFFSIPQQVYLPSANTRTAQRYHHIIKPYKGILLDRENELNRGLVGMWAMREGAGSKTADDSGSTFDLSLINSPTWVSAEKGNALRFNGSTTRAENTSTGSIRNLTYMTIAALFNTETLGVTAGTLYAAGDATSPANNDFVDLSVVDDGVTRVKTLNFRSGWSLTNGSWICNANSISVGKWFMAVVTYFYGNVSGAPTFYINGTKLVTTIVTASAGAKANNQIGQVTVGSRNTGASFFQGMIADVRVWNRILLDDEIKALYNHPYDVYNPPFHRRVLFDQPEAAAAVAARHMPLMGVG